MLSQHYAQHFNTHCTLFEIGWAKRKEMPEELIDNSVIN